MDNLAKNRPANVASQLANECQNNVSKSGHYGAMVKQVNFRNLSFKLRTLTIWLKICSQTSFVNVHKPVSMTLLSSSHMFPVTIRDERTHGRTFTLPRYITPFNAVGTV